MEFYERGDHMTKLAQRFDEFAELVTQEVQEMHPPAVWRYPFPESFSQRDRVTLDNGVRDRAVHAQVMLSEPGLRGWLKERAAWVWLKERAAWVWMSG